MVLFFASLCIAALFTAARGDFISTDYDAYNSGVLGHRPHNEFHSSPEFSPVLQVNIWNKSAMSDIGSHIFLRHDGNHTIPLASPLVLSTDDLSVVYMNRSFENVFNVRIQENFGKRYLTFWEGKKGGGVGDGYGLVYDDNYRLVYTISAQNISSHTDLHEFQFTGHGTVLVTGVDKVWERTVGWKWKGWAGSTPQRVLDAVFQEIDLETNEVLFSWRALDHISPMDSFEPPGVEWDAFHMNSIQKTQAGNYLISIRHIHSILLIDGKTGEIIWRLGGKGNVFTELPPAKGADPLALVLSMGWQHHARYVPGTSETQMTFFDNHGKVTTHEECEADCSRGLHIAIDDTVSPPTVRLLREYHHPSHLQAQSQGSIQPLCPEEDDLGNVFIGWGRCPTFTEHLSSGETVFDVQFSPWHSHEIPDALDNYRAFRMDWSATPWWDPSMALRKNSNGTLLVYVSWNGATEVRQWVLRGSVGDVGGAHGTKDELARSSRTGFETKLEVKNPQSRYLWVEALDKHGSVIGSTEVHLLNMTSLSVVTEAEEVDQGESSGDAYEEDQEEVEQASKVAGILFGVGLGLGLIATIVASLIILIRRRQRGYRRLNDNELAKSGPDSDRNTFRHIVSEMAEAGGEDGSLDETRRLRLSEEQ